MKRRKPYLDRDRERFAERTKFALLQILKADCGEVLSEEMYQDGEGLERLLQRRRARCGDYRDQDGDQAGRGRGHKPQKLGFLRARGAHEEGALNGASIGTNAKTKDRGARSVGWPLNAQSQPGRAVQGTRRGDCHLRKPMPPRAPTLSSRAIVNRTDEDRSVSGCLVARREMVAFAPGITAFAAHLIAVARSLELLDEPRLLELREHTDDLAHCNAHLVVTVVQIIAAGSHDAHAEPSPLQGKV
jgi:hypothetical protein